MKRLLLSIVGLGVCFALHASQTAVVYAAPVCTESDRTDQYFDVLCEPGFGYDQSLIRVYQADSVGHWNDDSTVTNAVWLIYPERQGKVGLVIRFRSNESGSEAAIFDDQDGDGQVAITISPGNLPIAVERPGIPSVVVSSRSPWKMQPAPLNMNIDLQVDGNIRAMLNSRIYQHLLKTDGRLDYEIHVRDVNNDGRPDIEWRQAYPPLPDGAAFERTAIMVNELRDEEPLQASFPWPYLGGESYEYVKPRGASLPPIQIDWEHRRVTQVGELVRSRGHDGYFVYSITRVGTKGVVDSDFESPFAFYSFPGAQPGLPDLTVRHVYRGPFNKYIAGGRFNQALEEVDYSWRPTRTAREGDAVWDFYLGLAGLNRVDSFVNLPEIGGLKMPRYEELPHWVINNPYAYMTFIAREGSGYPSSEGIYEWNPIEQAEPESWDYLQGRSNETPFAHFTQVPVGFRGEYSSRVGLKPWLYVSSIDKRFHLLGADSGVWNISPTLAMRYDSLGLDHIQRWTLEENGSTKESLARVGNRLMLQDANGLHFKPFTAPEEVLRTQAPTDARTWAVFNEQMRSVEASSNPDLTGIFAAVDAETESLPGATMRDFRRTEDGQVAFVLSVPNATGHTVDWLPITESGEYLVLTTVAGDARILSLTAAQLGVTDVRLLSDDYRVGVPTSIRVALKNSGTDRGSATVKIFARNEVGRVVDIASVEAEVAGVASKEFAAPWLPDEPGDWTIGVRVGDDLSSTARSVIVRAPFSTGVMAAVRVSDVPWYLMAAAAAVLIVGQGIALLVWWTTFVRGQVAGVRASREDPNAD